MKNFKIIITMLLFVINASAQKESISCINHTEERITSIRITDDVDLNALQVFEKLKFLKKRLVSKKSVYFNPEGNYNSSVKIVGHENMFPKWYVPATETQTTEDGVVSYYDRDSKYLSGGWPGARVNRDDKIVYKIDQDSGRRFGFRKYSPESLTDYNTRNIQIQESGLIRFYLFSPPNRFDLEEFERLGYRVYSDKNIVSLENSELLLTWNLNNFSISQTNYESGSIVRTITSAYQYNNVFQEYLISHQEIINFLSFTTGDCFEEVINTSYQDYNNDCRENATIRSSIKQEDSALTIYPNPSYDNITIGLPDYSYDYNLEIRDLAGKLLSTEKVAANSKTLRIDLGNYTSGVYLVRVVQDNQIFSKKFVKF